MNDDEAGAQADSGWIKTNRGVAACIAGVAIALLIYLSLSEWAYRVLRDGFRLGFFTTVSVVAMLLCAVIMIFDRRRHETDEDMAQATWRDWLVAAVAMATCYIYFLLAWNIDFLLVTPVFMAGGTYALGVRPIRSAIIAGIVITAVVYGIFHVLGVDIPTEITGL